MKHFSIFFVVLSVCIFLGINSDTSRELKAYKQYYEATENLLDTLENHYGWVDAFDPYDYYEAVENLGR